MNYKTEGQFFDKKLTHSYTEQEKRREDMN